MLCTELNDEVAFDGLFSNYGNSSPPKIWRNHTEMLEEEMLTLELWYLAVEEMYSPKELATLNCTGDYCYGKKALSP